MLTQWVDEPTRGKNVLDLVFSSDDDIISNLKVGERLGKGDHNMIQFEIKTNFSNKKKSFKKPNFRNANFERLQNEMGKLERNSEVDIESKWKSLKCNYMRIRNDCIQQKNVSLNKPEQPKWFNKDIAKQIGERQKAHNRLKLSYSRKYLIS